LTITFTTFEENRSATTSLKSAFAAVVIINAAAALARQARTVVLPLSLCPHALKATSGVLARFGQIVR
jgi:hypothetical protein